MKVTPFAELRSSSYYPQGVHYEVIVLIEIKVIISDHVNSRSPHYKDCHSISDKGCSFVVMQGKLLNHYLKIKRIGEGPFSKIKLMRNIKDNKEYAMKKYNLFILRKKIKMGAKVNGQSS